MKRLRRLLADAEYRQGDLLEVTPEDDVAHEHGALAPVELTPAGLCGPMLVLTPEDDKLAQPRAARREAVSAERRAAFLAEVDRHRRDHRDSVDESFRFRLRTEWADVIRDPAVWPELTDRFGAWGDTALEKALYDIGRCRFAEFMLDQRESTDLRNRALGWLENNWQEEWEALNDGTKRKLVERFQRQRDVMEAQLNGLETAREFVDALKQSGLSQSRPRFWPRRLP
jgi:hypothetical protein